MHARMDMRTRAARGLDRTAVRRSLLQLLAHSPLQTNKRTNKQTSVCAAPRKPMCSQYPGVSCTCTSQPPLRFAFAATTSSEQPQARRSSLLARYESKAALLVTPDQTPCRDQAPNRREPWIEPVQSLSSEGVASGGTSSLDVIQPLASSALTNEVVDNA